MSLPRTGFLKGSMAAAFLVLSDVLVYFMPVPALLLEIFGLIGLLVLAGLLSFALLLLLLCGVLPSASD